MNQVINTLRNFPLCLPRTKKIQHNVKNNAQFIQLRNELFYKFEKQVKKDKLKNNTAAKNISITAGKSNDVESRLSNILTLKQQAQDFLNEQRKNNITLNAIDSGVIVSDIQLKRPHAKKLRKTKTLTSNKRDFEEILKYIAQLESKIGITLEELSRCSVRSLKIFLPNYTKSLGKKYPRSQDARRDIISEINIQCNGIRDKLDAKRKELEEDLKHIEKLKAVTSSVYKIAEHNEAISNCQDFQNSYMKEKGEHPFRSSYCQKMIDIYQKNIQGYQAQIDHILCSVQEAFACISQTTRNLPDMKKFQAIINDVHKEHNVQQITKEVKSALCSLANVRNQIVSQNSGFLSDSSIYQHVNTGTEVTRI